MTYQELDRFFSECRRRDSDLWRHLLTAYIARRARKDNKPCR